MTPEAGYRGRFAPSPNGPLHFGSLVAALGSWLFARRAGGVWLVRVEDIDPPREVPGAARAQLATLARFGLVPDQPEWFQSRRGDAYRAALEQLADAGIAYRCSCSRSDLAAFGGVHPPRCVAPAGPGAAAWRVRVDDACVEFHDAIHGPIRTRLADTGDFVVMRRDGIAAYQLAVVVDDAAQGITQVVRGSDLLDSTPRQVFLQQALGLPTPDYAHLPLVLGEDGQKLGKSQGAVAVNADQPLPVLRAALAVLGQPMPAPCRDESVQRLLAAALADFDPARIPRHAVAAPGLPAPHR